MSVSAPPSVRVVVARGLATARRGYEIGRITTEKGGGVAVLCLDTRMPRGGGGALVLPPAMVARVVWSGAANRASASLWSVWMLVGDKEEDARALDWALVGVMRDMQRRAHAAVSPRVGVTVTVMRGSLTGGGGAAAAAAPRAPRAMPAPTAVAEHGGRASVKIHVDATARGATALLWENTAADALPPATGEEVAAFFKAGMAAVCSAADVADPASPLSGDAAVTGVAAELVRAHLRTVEPAHWIEYTRLLAAVSFALHATPGDERVHDMELSDGSAHARTWTDADVWAWWSACNDRVALVVEKDLHTHSVRALNDALFGEALPPGRVPRARIGALAQVFGESASERDYIEKTTYHCFTSMRKQYVSSVLVRRAHAR